MSDTPNIDAGLVRRLIAAQFPQWADLAVTPILPGGWDNRSFRLGDDMVVRLPSAQRYAPQVEKEQYWLPKLARELPVAIPSPLAKGEPGIGYPWHWSIYGWLDGETAQADRIADPERFAISLAEFLNALQQIDGTDGPPPGAHNFHRGGPLTAYDAETRTALADLDGKIDSRAAIAIWEAARATSWTGAPRWLHGDFAPSNLLVKDGALSAVIDFGCCGGGDPACDLAIGWTFFEADTRRAFRAAIDIDDATWLRGGGWALWKAAIVLAGRPGTNAAERDRSETTLRRLLADDALITG
ncbi:aminoglycoside phosphotransferase family protein [Parasphingopyxis sp.]|uniref:aminoglycoside phosphotransferase family protein n=1 Tax=Parasphingopyxis sp. TaxID=1920299 RepID=UPI00262E3AA7|nr:aminoglycoside phosphotransferase family protein [Parasphingopyxis sp.]